MLQDDVIQSVLQKVMEAQFSRIRPSTKHFFELTQPPGLALSSVSIHAWGLAEIEPTDTVASLKFLATEAAKAVSTTTDKMAGELIFRRDRLLPYLPVWTDGLPLFDENGDDRFGVPGGNVVPSCGDAVEDIENASQCLIQLNEEYDGDERLLVFCAKPLEKELIRAAAKARVNCRVFGLFHYKQETSWVVTRDLSPYGLYIGRPSFDLPVEGNKLVVGARYVTWITDPRHAVCITR
ncbi:MAG: hypothetical protein AB7L09_00545 [Nitrospira sp.]